MGVIPLRDRRSPDGVPYWVAVHESSHAVAHWQIALELKLWVPGFYGIAVRTPTEVAAGPHVDHKGRESDVLGAVDGPSLYQGTGNMGAMLAPGAPRADFNGHPDGYRLLAEAEAVTRLAGPAGEAKYIRHKKQEFWEILAWEETDDWRTASRCAWDFAASDADFEKFIAKVRRKATRIVRRHWSSVIALADALMVQHSLSADEALPIMEAASLSN